MEKHILQDQPPKQRAETLEATANEVVKEKYYQKLTGDELTAKKAEFTANALSIEDLEEKKKDAIDEFKGLMLPLKDSNKVLSTEIRTGFVQKECKLYVMIDTARRMAYYYDETGELVDTKTRPATADEIGSPTIFMNIRTGTNN